MQKSELIQSFKDHYNAWINPLLKSVLYCQVESELYLKIYCEGKEVIKEDLCAISGKRILGDENMVSLEVIQRQEINHSDELEDNIFKLLGFDHLTHIIFGETIFTKEAI